MLLISYIQVIICLHIVECIVDKVAVTNHTCVVATRWSRALVRV